MVGNLIYNPFIATILCLCFIVLFVTGLSGNIWIIITVLRQQALRRSLPHCFIANIALVNCLLCLVSIPFTVLPSYLGGWYFGWLACHLAALLTSAAVINLALTVVVLAVERYCKIVRYEKPSAFTSPFAVWAVVMIWIMANVISLPYAVYANYLRNSNGIPHCTENFPDVPRRVFWGTTFILAFSVPLIISIIVYRAVFAKLRSTPDSVEDDTSSDVRDSERRISVVALKITLMLGIFWLPLHLNNALGDFAGISFGRFTALLHFIMYIIAISSVIWLPVICSRGDIGFRRIGKRNLSAEPPTLDNDRLLKEI